jgi:hypothetical protein
MTSPEFVVNANFGDVFSIGTFGLESCKFFNINFVCLTRTEIPFLVFLDMRVNSGSYFVGLSDVVGIRIPYCRPVVTLVG